MSRDAVTGVTCHPLCRDLVVRNKSQVLPTLGWMTRRSPGGEGHGHVRLYLGLLSGLFRESVFLQKYLLDLRWSFSVL